MQKNIEREELIKAIKLFKTESNKKIELSYLRFLTGNYKTKLFFTNSTSTDGSNVYIHVDHPYITNPKNNALERTFEDLDFDKKYLDNKFTILKLFCRGGLVHEAGHILFNDFELLAKAKKEFKGKDYKYFHQLLNIVLDANMELSIINYYEGVREYLEFSNCLAYHNLDTVEEYEEKSSSLISTYYYWAMFYTIMGREKGNVKNPEIIKYIEETKPLLTKARYERDIWVKYSLIKEIFSILKPLIEESEQNNDFEFDLENFFPQNSQIQPNSNGSSTSSQDVEIKIDFKTSENKNEENQESNSNENQESNSNGNSDDSSNSSNSNGNNQENDNSQEKTENNSKSTSKSKSKKNQSSNDTQNDNQQVSFSFGFDDDMDFGFDDNNDNDMDLSFGLGEEDNEEEDNNSQNTNNSNENDNSDEEENNTSKNEDSNSANSNTNQEKSEEDIQREKEYLKELMETLTKDLEKVEKLEEKAEKERQKENEIKSKHQKHLSNLDYNDINKSMEICEVDVRETSNYHVNQYEDIYEELKPQIKSFTKKLLKTLKEQREDYETRLISGSRLDMRRIYDKKDLVWKSKKDNKEFADLTISVYVDGSQSMGDKLRYVKKSLVMLHAACVELSIPLTVVEGRAVYNRNKVDHMVLCNFSNYKKEDTKYNMVKITADDNTREGVSLKWVNEYHKIQNPTSDKLMIVLSDGEPFHLSRNGYYTGDGMIKDCKDTFKKISKDTVVMPIALGEGVYDSLTEIYPKVINCEEEHFSKLGDILCKQIKKNLYKR